MVGRARDAAKVGDLNEIFYTAQVHRIRSWGAFRPRPTLLTCAICREFKSISFQYGCTLKRMIAGCTLRRKPQPVLIQNGPLSRFRHAFLDWKILPLCLNGIALYKGAG